MSNIIDEENCPFCKPKHPSCFHSTELVKGIWDGFPLTPGHALLMPHRHVASWFDATSEEQAALISAIKEVKLEIEKQYLDR